MVCCPSLSLSLSFSLSLFLPLSLSLLLPLPLSKHRTGYCDHKLASLHSMCHYYQSGSHTRSMLFLAYTIQGSHNQITKLWTMITVCNTYTYITPDVRQYGVTFRSQCGWVQCVSTLARVISIILHTNESMHTSTAYKPFYLHLLTKLKLLIIGTKRKDTLWLLMNTHMQKLSGVLIDNAAANRNILGSYTCTFVNLFMGKINFIKHIQGRRERSYQG